MGGTIEGDRSAHRARGVAVQSSNNRADPTLHALHSNCRIILCRPGECYSGSRAEDEIEGVIAAQGRDPDGGLIAMPDWPATECRPSITIAFFRNKAA